MKTSILLLCLGLAIGQAPAQTSARNDELKFNADYFLMRQEFGKALGIYLDVLRTEPENADIMHRIGICYLNSEDEKEKAIPYLEEAVKKVSEKYNVKSFKETNAPIEAYFLLGSAYRVSNRLTEAIEAYRKYRDYLNPRDDYNLQATDQYISSCQVAQEMQQHPKEVVFTNLGAPVNNKLPNFNAVVSGNGKKLIYTSPGRQGYEIYQSMLTDTGWTVPVSISTMLGKGKYMKTCYLSPDGTWLILVLEDPEDSQLLFSRETRGRWSRAELFPKPVNSSYNETHGCLSADGKILYFTSNRRGGEGDLDIYRSDLAEGVWGQPRNLGPGVNTPFNEETPFVSMDGSLLFFSSDGYRGMGGYDVYRYDFTHPDAGVVNLGYPVNTTDNNLFYVPLWDGMKGLYAFRGPDSQGGRDIYQVSIIPEVTSQPVEEVKVPEEDTVQATGLMPVAETLPAPAENAVPETIPEIVPEKAPARMAETVPETVPEPVTETVPEMVPEPIDETVPEKVPEPMAETIPESLPEAMTELVPEGFPESMEHAFAVQFMALRRKADLRYFTGLTDIMVTYSPDAWHRYTWITTTDSLQAVRIRDDLAGRGYKDAFIRRKSVVGRFTIQVMAVPGPVIDLNRFRNLPDISVTRGSDTFCRYTTGGFSSEEEALAELDRIRSLGYRDAFVRKVRILQ